MKEQKEYGEIMKNRHHQILKVVSKSFYKELVKFGISTKDLVTVSLNLLDYITTEDRSESERQKYYNHLFKIADVENNWEELKKLQIQNVCIQMLEPQQITQVAEWLQNPVLRFSFIPPFPETAEALHHYFFEASQRCYFGIYFQEQFVGIIGADNMDQNARKLEMKKFVGDPNLQGRGIGKRATFLFLYYAFNVLDFNKVYIHSIEANIRNLNLNSRFGFELEGIFFNEIFLEGEYKDVIRMALLKQNWEKIFS